jgi:hypothetical protein
VYYGEPAASMENKVLKKSIPTPKFKNGDGEADWWASREGRDYVKRRSTDPKSKGPNPRDHT